ncbi:MAG: uracil-DNA glycosylase [Betaproteobacteria bacterium]|nr:uracil-DNA glycosylase [Betaproteobacteria bacterium]
MSRHTSPPGATYDPDCRACQRLATFLDKVKAANPVYFCKPVPPFGDDQAWLLIVGLAPGMHGANASGRPFTGDYAGILLYQTLFDFGWATSPQSLSATDDLKLTGARLTNAVKCLPPDNKPTPAEAKKCNTFLANELRALPAGGAVLALGRIAHDAVLRALGERAAAHAFGHGAAHRVGAAASPLTLFDSYHCSRYNTNTRRLTPEMFRDVFEKIKKHHDGSRKQAG